MKLCLANSLVSNAPSNPDKLSLDLNFAADKTLTARKGPTPVFTRGTNATYIGSDGLINNTTGIHQPRFDHDPVTLACKGLLIEEARTNLLLQSAAFSSSSWIKTNSTVSGTLHVSPDGTSNANELVEDSLTTTHTINQGTVSQATIGASYTYSVFVKRKDSSNQYLLIGATGLISAAFVSVNLVTGAVTTNIGSPSVPTNVGSVAYPNGWYRVYFTVTATTVASMVFDIRLSRDGLWANRSYLGDGVQSSLIYGAQLELGSFTTSYIPTTTGTVARSADVCSITSATLWNTSEGTLFTHSILPAGGYDCYPANWVNYFGHRRSATNSLLGMIRGGGTFDITLAASGIAAATLKIASSYGEGSQSAVYNNGTVTSQTTAFTLSPTVLNLGANSATTCINGHLSSVKYYRKKLSNAKLQTITV